ncbi:MAG: hypothetical protein K2X03_01195 [Bryobacteraceae bacterium]|nr:hypothetical protein [Bryobacteraceae bacterium]
MESGLILADDATGTMECASLLASLGVAAKVGLLPGAKRVKGVLVVDTESRHLTPPQAARSVAAWTNKARAVIFKKTDSILRGNIAAELLALRSLGPVVYIPAYPRMGRTVHQGHLLVDGEPVNGKNILDLFPPDTAKLIPHPKALAAHLSSGKILICDARTDTEIQRLVTALRAGPVTIAGPAGVLPAWASRYAFPRAEARPLPKLEPWLVVCGSLHPMARAQARFALDCGATVIGTPRELSAAGQSAAVALAKRAAPLINGARRQGVLVIGGDTAWALWRELGITRLEALPEVLPGVAACRAPEIRRVFVTKAGGFGQEDLFHQMRTRFL